MVPSCHCSCCWSLSGTDLGFLEGGGEHSPWKGLWAAKACSPRGGLGVLPPKNLKTHVCQMHFPGNWGNNCSFFFRGAKCKTLVLKNHYFAKNRRVYTPPQIRRCLLHHLPRLLRICSSVPLLLKQLFTRTWETLSSYLWPSIQVP